MSKIKQLLMEKDNVIVMDVDGVLALQEWGEYNHFDLSDEEWSVMANEQEHFYGEELVSKKMQAYLADKDPDLLFVISKAYTKNEDESKVYYCSTYYPIPRDHIFFVRSDKEKVEVFKKIIAMFPNVPNHKKIMIEDTVSILNDIKEQTGCATVHISSFLDL
ncbi:MAG: hypothetical protein IKI57_02935 [Clostridia bacterium]|nr:hypothetical protein [Clostridia bacterium]